MESGVQMVFKYWLQLSYSYQVGDTETVHQVMALAKSMSQPHSEQPSGVTVMTTPILFPRVQ